jgi:23S rRNA (guanosine2251-2'-O)-methyltransferase
VLELLAARRRPVKQVFVADGLEPSSELDEIARLASQNGVRMSIVSHRRIDADARTKVNQGVIAIAAPLRPSELDELCGVPAKRATDAARPRPRPSANRTPFLLVLDGVTDPQNVGALMRSAECAGMTGVVLGRHRAAHVTPSVAKAAAGAIEYLDIAVVPGIPAALARMSGLGVESIGLDPGADRSIYELESVFHLDPSRGVALVVGDEGKGLGSLTRRRCSALVSIPVHGRIESLNVASAGAVAFFEISRRLSASAV